MLQAAAAAKRDGAVGSVAALGVLAFGQGLQPAGSSVAMQVLCCQSMPSAL